MMIAIPYLFDGSGGMTEKQCKSCGDRLPLESFYRHPDTLDGRLSICKECHKEAARRNRRNNPAYQEYERQRAKLPHRKENADKIRRRWSAENPKARKAHSTLNYHLRIGSVVREPCVFCGSNQHIHAHHRDYDSPLDVVWLCAKCHHRLHALFPEVEGRNKADTEADE